MARGKFQLEKGRELADDTLSSANTAKLASLLDSPEKC
jgi:hypothetical protein